MALSYISEKINIFFSVASTPQDRNLFNELQKHLSLQRRLGLIEFVAILHLPMSARLRMNNCCVNPNLLCLRKIGSRSL